MNRYEIDFIALCGMWCTYDIRADTQFDAACELLRFERDASISSIVFMGV